MLLPPPAEIILDVDRRDANGARWHGEALIGWLREGERYRVTVQAGVRRQAGIDHLVVTSEGALDATGFSPRTMTEQRPGRAMTATHFDRAAQRITFSASTAAFPLAPGAQDRATVPLQLAAIGRADATQLATGVTLLVADDRGASLLQFVLVGQERLDTGLGRINTWHLMRTPGAAAYSTQLDIWLAPAHGWLPVQIRNTEPSGAVTTQTASRILVLPIRN